jgi:hypothetical protein
MGFMNTIEDAMGCPGIDSNQMLTIRSLRTPSGTNTSTNRVRMLTGTDIDGSCGE